MAKMAILLVTCEITPVFYVHLDGVGVALVSGRLVDPNKQTHTAIRSGKRETLESSSAHRERPRCQHARVVGSMLGLQTDLMGQNDRFEKARYRCRSSR